MKHVKLVATYRLVRKWCVRSSITDLLSYNTKKITYIPEYLEPVTK